MNVIQLHRRKIERLPQFDFTELNPRDVVISLVNQEPSTAITTHLPWSIGNVEQVDPTSPFFASERVTRTTRERYVDLSGRFADEMLDESHTYNTFPTRPPAHIQRDENGPLVPRYSAGTPVITSVRETVGDEENRNSVMSFRNSIDGDLFPPDQSRDPENFPQSDYEEDP